DVDPHVAADCPAQFREPLGKRHNASLRFRVVCGEVHEHANAPHPPRLLRARRERPRHCAAERSYHFPPSDSDWHVALPCEGWLVKGTIYHSATMRSLRFEVLGNRVNVPAVHIRLEELSETVLQRETRAPPWAIVKS